MGPNSGGGKRNKDNNNPAIGGARNRFSKWKPPTKDLKDKFSKQHDKRVTEHEAAATTDKKLQPTAGGISNVKLAGQKVGQQPLLAVGGEMISIHANVVGELLRIFQVEAPPTPSVISVPRESASSKASSVPEKEVMVHHLSSKPLPTPAVAGKAVSLSASSKGDNDALGNRQLRSLLTKYGFEMTDISDVLQDIGPATQEENLLVVKMLAKLSQQPFHTQPSSSTKVEVQVDLSVNEDLMGELEVLSSIYMEHVTYRGCLLGGQACCVVDVSIPLECDITPPAEKKPAPKNKKAIEAHYVQVRVFIPAVSVYPCATSLIYGWILPSDFVPDNSSSSKQVKSAVKLGTSALLPTSVVRQLSIQAMAHIHAYQMQCEAPAVFEFLQHIRENLSSALSAHYLAHPSNVVGAPVDPIEAPGLSGHKNPHHKKATHGSSAKPAVVELPPPEVVGPPPMPPRPTTNFMQGIEYRTALSGAFSASLVGEAARARAHAELEFLLPKARNYSAHPQVQPFLDNSTLFPILFLVHL